MYEYNIYYAFSWFKKVSNVIKNARNRKSQIPQNSLTGVAMSNLTHTPVSPKPNMTSDPTNQ